MYLIKSKDKTIEKFLIYKIEVENQQNKKIKVWSDRGGEYEWPFENFHEHGIRHETSAPYSPQQDGIAERKNRILKDIMNVMFLSYGLPQSMWSEYMVSANYLLYRYLVRNWTKVHMNYGMEDHHPINTYDCGGVLLRLLYLHPRKLKLNQKLLIAYSLEMHITILLIVFLYVSLKLKIYRRTR